MGCTQSAAESVAEATNQATPKKDIRDADGTQMPSKTTPNTKINQITGTPKTPPPNQKIETPKTPVVLEAMPSSPASTTSQSTSWQPKTVVELHPDSITGESTTSFRAKYKMIDSDLGSGAYSVVKLATNRETKEKVAVKCISRKELSGEDEVCIRKEVEILKSCDHPNIVKFYDFYEEKRSFYITMEMCEGGELFNRIVQRRSYDENDARDVIYLVLSAMRYCHDRGIVHRDLKPENLLLKSFENDTDIKLVDFGFATVATNEVALKTRCGSQGYTAPEILKNQKYGPAVDLWSIGVITFVLLGGYPPFRHENEYRLNKIIKQGRFTFEPRYWSTVSEDAKDLIRKLLTVDPSMRPSAAEALSHPWFKRTTEFLRSYSNNFDALKEFVSSGASTMSPTPDAATALEDDEDDFKEFVEEGEETRSPSATSSAASAVTVDPEDVRLQVYNSLTCTDD